MFRKLSKIQAIQQQELGGRYDSVKDPLRDSVVLHLATQEGWNGSTNNLFIDESPNRFSVTRNGNVSPSTFSPFGNSWSNSFDGSGDYLSVANNSALQFAEGDFTVEAWFYIESNSGLDSSSVRNAALLGSNITGAVVNRLLIEITGNSTTTGTGIRMGMYNSSNVGFDITRTFTVSQKTWHHIAITRQGSTLRMFFNGLQQGASWTSSVSINTGASFIIGGHPSGVGFERYFNGRISNFRIIKGNAIYASDFVPSKTPLAAISGTSLLTCASNRFRDSSSNNFTITPNGTVAVRGNSPFAQKDGYSAKPFGYCVNFNGTTQYIQTPAASAANNLQLGASDFTIEFWIKGKPQSGYKRVIDCGTFNNSNYGFTIVCDNSLGQSIYFEVYKNQSTDYNNIQLTGVLNNAWNHVAITRVGDVISGYVNGTYQSTFTLNSNNRNLNYVTPITIGCYKDPSTSAYSAYFSGKISNVHIVKTAIYNGNFIPNRSAPLSRNQVGVNGIYQSSLIACSTDAIREITYYHTLTTGGAPVADSDGPNAQDAELSYYFDGNGDYLSIADNAALEIGSGDFTIETWVNFSSYSTDVSYNSTICQKDSSYSLNIRGTINSFTTFAFAVFDGVSWNSAEANISIGLNRWYHFAASRAGTVLRLFVDGVLVNANNTYNYTAANNTNALLIGSHTGSGRYVNGYISNFRLVTGAALYTADFTPSRKPLPIAPSGATSLITCRGRAISDESANNFIVTPVGNAGVSSLSPFREQDTFGSSYYMDGSADNFTMGGQTGFAFGTGDFCLEFWHYPVTTATQGLYDSRPTGSSGAYLAVFCGGSPIYISLWVSNATRLVCSVPLRLNAWNHIVISRASGVTRIFVNGDAGADTWNDATNYIVGAGRPIIGRNGFNTAASANGYFSDFSVYKGTSRGYTSNFAPPTTPLRQRDAQQVVLIRSQDTIQDLTRRHAIETVGNARVSGGPPYSANYFRHSHYFDGSGDYLDIPASNDFSFGTGDFTIETWVWINASSALDGSSLRHATIASVYNNAGNGWYMGISGNASTTGTGLWFFNQNSSVSSSVNENFSITQQTWHHIVISRRSGTMYFFLNGIQQGAGTAYTAQANCSSNLWIGATNSIANYNRYFHGYLHDLRITKGVARYTSNFTVPKNLLPSK